MLKTLNISETAYKAYTETVKGNHKLTKLEVAKKLTRNAILGLELPLEHMSHTWYAYGKLRMLVDSFGTIVFIVNHAPVIDGWEVDEDVKKSLNKLLKIS